ncbi:MAG TPA: hypothetical protein DCM67_11295 [Propionibacteriaceae bacterium]|nr:hypothetical protein [Propionibacteriaceae bacterium]
MFKRGRLAGLIAFLALGLAAVPALPAQAEDGAGMKISGTVTIYDDSVNQHRRPLANARVCEGGPDSNCATTDDNGHYTLTNVVGWDRGAGFNEALPTVFPADEAQAALFMPTDYTYGSSTAHQYLPVHPGQAVTGINISVHALTTLAGNGVDGSDRVKQTAPLTAGSPKVLGKKQVGKVLRVNAGRWSPSPAKLTYRWYRGGHRIAGATHKTYRLTVKDRRKRIQVRVVAMVVDQKIIVRSKPTQRVR